MQINPVAALPIAKNFFREPPCCLFRCCCDEPGSLEADLEREDQENIVDTIKIQLDADRVSAILFPRIMAELQAKKGDLALWEEAGFGPLLRLDYYKKESISSFVQHTNKPSFLRPFYTRSASDLLKTLGYGFLQRHLWRVDLFWKMRLWWCFSAHERAYLAIRLDDVQALQSVMKNPVFSWKDFSVSEWESKFKNQGRPLHTWSCCFGRYAKWDSLLEVEMGRGLNLLHLAAYYNRPKVLEMLLSQYRSEDSLGEKLRQHCFRYSEANFFQNPTTYTPAGVATELGHQDALQVFLNHGLYTAEDFSWAVRGGRDKLVNFINSSRDRPFPIRFQDCFLPNIIHYQGTLNGRGLGIVGFWRSHLDRAILPFFKQFLHQLDTDPNTLVDANGTPALLSILLDFSTSPFDTSGHIETLFLLAGHPRTILPRQGRDFDIDNRRACLVKIADFLALPNRGEHRPSFLARGLQLSIEYKLPVAAAYFLEQGAVWDKEWASSPTVWLKDCDPYAIDLFAVLVAYDCIDRTFIKPIFHQISSMDSVEDAIKAALKEKRQRVTKTTLHLLLGTQAHWLGDGARVHQEPATPLQQFAAHPTFDRNVVGLIHQFMGGFDPENSRSRRLS